MADTNKYIGGIVIQAEGFEVGANAPVDSRFRVKNAQGLNELLTYEGLISYNEADKTYYQFVDGAWKALSVKSAAELEKIITDLIATTATGAMNFRGATAALPENPAQGDMWKVAGENINIVIDEKVAKVGDTIIYNGEKWTLIPSGDDIEDTWRKVIAGGNELANNEALEFVAGENITITEDGGKVTISSTYEDTHYESKLVVGNSNADAADEAVVENGNVHLNLIEDGVVKSSHKIVGMGGITVTHEIDDTDGNVITIEAPEGAKYDLAAKTENNEAILSLAGTDNTEDKVAIVGNDAVAVTVDGGKIKVSAHDTKYTGSNGTGVAVEVVDDGAITATIEDNAVVTAKIANKNVTREKLADDVITALDKDDNTTYGFEKKAGTDLTFTVTPSEGDAYDVTLEAGALAVKDKVSSGDLEGSLSAQINGNTQLANENRSAISAINNAETGILAQAKAYADGLTPVGDNKSIEVGEDGTISVVGFNELGVENVGYLPRVGKVVDKEATYTYVPKTATASATSKGSLSCAIVPPIGENDKLTSVTVKSATVQSEKGLIGLSADQYKVTKLGEGYTFMVNGVAVGATDVVAINYEYTYDEYTIDTPEECHFEIEWAPVDAIVEGDTNTKTVVKAAEGGVVTVNNPEYNAEADTYTYTIDVDAYGKQEADNKFATIENLNGTTDRVDTAETNIATLIKEVYGTTGTDGDSRIHDQGREITDLTERLDTLEEADTVEGSIKKTVKDAIGVLETKLTQEEDHLVVVEAERAEFAEKAQGDTDTIKNTYETKGDAAAKLAEAKKYADDLVDAIPAQTDYTVTVTAREDQEGDDHNAFKHYIFTQCGNEIGHIDVPRDLVVQSGTVEEVTEAGKPYAGAVVGDKYIKLVIANQDAPIYIPAKDLVDIYTAKDVTGVQGAEIQVAISNTNEISASLVNGGITEAKLAEGVKTKLNKVWQEVGDYKVEQTAVANKITDKAHVLTSLTQNENGEIAYEVKTLTPSDIGAASADKAFNKVTVLGKDLADQGELTVAEAKEALGLKALAGKDKIVDADIADDAKIAVGKIDGLGALATKDKVTEGDIDGTIAVGKINGLGGLATKDTIVEGDITGTIAVGKINGLGNLATKNNIVDADIAANAAIAKTKLAQDVQTSLGKADTALQQVEVGTGLTVTNKAENKQTINIDENVVFILDCNY